MVIDNKRNAKFRKDAASNLEQICTRLNYKMLIKNFYLIISCQYHCGRCSGLMISVLDSRVSILSLSPSWGQKQCCVLRQDTLLSLCISPPRCL